MSVVNAESVIVPDANSHATVAVIGVVQWECRPERYLRIDYKQKWRTA